MKAICAVCETSYTVPDDKVAGKLVKVRCAKCGATIVADGRAGATPNARPAAVPPPPVTPQPVPQTAAPQPVAPQPVQPGTTPQPISRPTAPPATPRPAAPPATRPATAPPATRPATAPPATQPAPSAPATETSSPVPRPPSVSPPSVRPRRPRPARPQLPAYRPRTPPLRAEPPALPFAPKVGLEAGRADFEIPIEFNFDSHYDVLGLPRNATSDEITRAKFDLHAIYDRRARAGDDAATRKLQKVNEAQELLSKPDKRARYDREAEAIFLTIQDPFPYERLTWNDGLALIRELTMTATDRDPIHELEARIDDRERASALLDSLESGQGG